MSRRPDAPRLCDPADGCGHEFWISLDQPATAGDGDEFPAPPDLAATAIERRRFLQLMAASLAAAGLSACGDPPEAIVPAVVASPRSAPGDTRVYATAGTLGGHATGVLVTHRSGRPIKVDGNPDHPASLGATDVFAQAAILDLYDPARARAVTFAGRVRAWNELALALLDKASALRPRRGDGLRVLSGAVSSPTLAAQRAALAARFPDSRWHYWEPAGRDNVLTGSRIAFGRPLEPICHLDRAAVVLAIDSDLLSSAPGHLRYARDFARGRAAEAGAPSRLYAIESTPSLTGAAADHRFVLRPDEIAMALRELAARFVAGPPAAGATAPPWLDALARDLTAHHGGALVHVGAEAPAEWHAIGHALNAALGAFGRTLSLIEPVMADSTEPATSLSALVADMEAGKVDTLLIFSGDPVYSAPADLDFGNALGRVPLSLYLGSHADATSARCHWHVPQAHAFETWSDARAFDGTVSIQQPQIQPLFNGRSAHELLGLLLGESSPDSYRLVRAHWQAEAARRGVSDFDAFWSNALRRGVVPDTAAPAVDATVKHDLPATLRFENPAPTDAIEILFRPDPALWDGRFASNGWLQELPRPLTRLTWDNAALIAPGTADRLGLANGEVVTLRVEGRSLRAPVWILPGQARECITLPLGYGRKVSSHFEAGGFNASRLRFSESLWRTRGVSLERTGGHVPLATTQHHQVMAGRDLVRMATYAQLAGAAAPDSGEEPRASLYPGYRYEGHAWGMAVDLSACIGCGACVIACQAENNIPVVGKAEVLRGRAMHWLRIDRYYRGEPAAPETAFQPVPCMHCENAPCEVVCPVQATMHDAEGLNAMVYNRCVGTRFCSNNCPYKVRRFNFFDYAGHEDRPAEARNPEVSVRGRGVMEKCTYCVQRIRNAHITADREERPIRDGEVVTACQAACPTQAIVFGDVNDPQSEVSRRKASPLDYALLAELNTRPRTTYTTRLRNPNPEIGEG